MLRGLENMNGLNGSLEKTADPKIPTRIGGVPKNVKIRIKRILGISIQQPFPRCPGQGNTCKKVAGTGTHGDFYGLGLDTGHYGIGLCNTHEGRTCLEKSWQQARNHMEAFKSYGHHVQGVDEFVALSEQKAVEVYKYNEIRRGMDLVISTLKEFESKVTNENNPLTEYVTGPKGTGSSLEPASDVTRMDLALRIAKTLSGIKMDDFKLSAHDYMHVDELTLRIPKEIAHGKRMFAKLRDLLFKYKDGERNPIEQIEEEYINGLKEVWSDVKTGEKI